MSKFKVGDKVKIVSQSICDHYDMLGMKVGDVVEIMGIHQQSNRDRFIEVEHECLPILVGPTHIEAIDNE
jgi:ribosomal protein S17